MSQGGSTQAGDGVQAAENRMLSSIERLVSTKLNEFELKLNASQRELSETQFAKIQQNLVANDSYNFKKKGNEEQYKVNVQVLSKLKEADGLLVEATSSGNLQSASVAREKVVEGIDVLSHRQKLIKLADTSDLGWRVVQEYEAHPLADDEEDEKKIYRAQMKAERKAKQSRQARSRRGPYQLPGSHTVVVPGSTAQTYSSSSTGFTTPRRKPGSCFKCGKPGHWQDDCRKTSAPEPMLTDTQKVSKISISLNCSEFGKYSDKITPKYGANDLGQIFTPLENGSNQDKSGSEVIVTPVGRLKANIGHWKASGASEYILDVVNNGYKLPFKNIPEKAFLKNNRSSIDNADFVSAEIQKLVSKGCVGPVEYQPHVVNPLTVASGRSGLRLEQAIAEEVTEAGALDFGDLPRKMADKLVQSRSDNTTYKYFSYFKRWEQFITSKGGVSIPASPIHVALYLTFLMDKGDSSHVVSATFYSIKWAHFLRGLVDPTENSFVKNLLDTAKRTLTKPVQKKEPVSSDMLKELCALYSDSTDILVVRDLCMILLGYSGFLRYDEISSLCCNDISLHEDHLNIRIKKSKTDQMRFGDQIVISKGESLACPYSMLVRYLDLTQQSLSDKTFLFRPCFRSGKTCKLIYKNKALSYTRARECITARLKPVSGGLNIGLHSLRSGGATMAANSGVNDRCLKRHGRWKSDSSKDRYVADSLSRRLEVSKSLKL